MGKIDQAASARGVHTKEIMTQIDASTCYFHGEYVLKDKIPEKTDDGRSRIIAKLAWGTAVKFMAEKRKKKTA